MNSREIIARLNQDGWILTNVRGSHHNYKHPTKPGRVTVPHPKKDLPLGTVRNIFRQAGWQWPRELSKN
ncbi:MAG: type II toxin-antitoxin system HicA family toxin [Xenococcaceae cyanobacterium]